MKFYQSHFEEYINECKRANLHPNNQKIYNNFPQTIHELKNMIFYGPAGTGKYSQMLYSIQKYSNSELKYEKKISITYNKQQFFFKISDIHFEIDMSLLGCNSKLLWHDIYLQLVDIISAKADKTGIIVCKNFHEIHNELLENFYSYMQQNNLNSIHLKFIIITEQLSFIPDNIINCCEIINISRPKKTVYNKCLTSKLPTNLKLENITNIKNLNLFNENIMVQHKIICNKIINNMINVNEIKFIKFRDLLYDIFIYNLNIYECVWYILSSLIEKEYIKAETLSNILIKTYCFFQYYNNNYRPIYHLENYLLYITCVIHKYA